MTIMERREVVRGFWGVTRLSVAGAALVLAASCSSSGSGSADSGPNPNTSTTSTPKPEHKATQPPSLKSYSDINARWSGLICQYKKRTVQPGDTVYDLTTKNLETDDYFKNRVFKWNMDHLKEQAATRPELANPDNLKIGTKFTILADCVDIGWMYQDWRNDTNGKKPINPGIRPVTFQNYSGTDGATHHLTTVYYRTDKDGQFIFKEPGEAQVSSCGPIPECFDYVPEGDKLAKRYNQPLP